MIKAACSSCPGTSIGSISESFRRGRIVWSIDYRCERDARHILHVDESGRVREPYRSIILAHESYRLDPTSPIPELTGMRAMRNLYEATVRDARARWHEFLNGRLTTSGETAELAEQLGGAARFVRTQPG